MPHIWAHSYGQSCPLHTSFRMDGPILVTISKLYFSESCPTIIQISSCWTINLELTQSLETLYLWTTSYHDSWGILGVVVPQSIFLSLSSTHLALLPWSKESSGENKPEVPKLDIGRDQPGPADLRLLEPELRNWVPGGCWTPKHPRRVKIYEERILDKS